MHQKFRKLKMNWILFTYLNL